MKQSDIGIIGIGVMGRSLALNFISRGFAVSGYNRTTKPTEELQQLQPQAFTACSSLEELVNSLKKPARVFMMVPAGKPVDESIEQLKVLLKPGDILMDGGNSFFKDTMRREQSLALLGIHYFGIGVSGGEEGALKGPSIMPGGDQKAYQEIAPILEAAAAQKDGVPCCTWIGPNGAGHYVKMVHNGIEYADMQLIAEAYLLLKKSGRTNTEISEIFKNWNGGETESYLLSITAEILLEKDDRSNSDLVDLIQDAAANKGTGKWTGIESLQQEYNASLLTAAFQARIISNDTDGRAKMNHLLTGGTVDLPNTEVLHRAYFLSRLAVYAQGFGLYKDASRIYHWNLNLEKIASIFRAGCIIQASLLDEIMKCYEQQPQLDNLLTADLFQSRISSYSAGLQAVVSAAVPAAVPVPLFMGAWVYLSQLSADLLGANLIQAQRDYFGAHRFLRKGSTEPEHHQWMK